MRFLISVFKYAYITLLGSWLKIVKNVIIYWTLKVVCSIGCYFYNNPKFCQNGTYLLFLMLICNDKCCEIKLLESWRLNVVDCID